jgi:GMP synthase PP-ATPase subunit
MIEIEPAGFHGKMSQAFCKAILADVNRVVHDVSSKPTATIE